jgi:hypothetical protein
MKRIVLLTFIGSLALALTAWGAPRDRQARSAKGKTSSAHVASARSGTHAAKARTSRSAAPRVKSHSITRARLHERAAWRRQEHAAREQRIVLQRQGDLPAAELR